MLRQKKFNISSLIVLDFPLIAQLLPNQKSQIPTLHYTYMLDDMDDIFSYVIEDRKYEDLKKFSRMFSEMYHIKQNFGLIRNLIKLKEIEKL